MTRLEDLEREARARVEAVQDDPDARYALRQRFYARWGGDPSGGPGLGYSELRFLEWELRRGVLRRPEEGGSAWWRAVNEQLLYDAELAALVEERLPELDVGLRSVRLWRTYLREPSPRSWYRAHNSSVVAGYLGARELAHREPWSERVFVNVVLYRLLFAQGLVEGLELGELGKLLADPRSPSVEMLLDLPEFYPAHYELSSEDVAWVLERGRARVGDVAPMTFDDLFVVPGLSTLYRHAAAWIGEPALEHLIRHGRPCYPSDLAPEATRPHDCDEGRPARDGQKTKIAILGGGPAGLAAAHELSRDPDWRDHYEVTVYQIGWRLGGKMATGVGPCGRVEERGIHIFQGWYHNAFAMVREAYDYVAEHRLAEGSPLHCWQEAFVPDPPTLFTERGKDGEWTNWPVLIPYNESLPGEGGPPPLPEVLGAAVGLIVELVLGSPYREDRNWLERLLSSFVIERWFTPPWERGGSTWWQHALAFAEGASAAPESLEIGWAEKASALLRGLEEEPTLELGGVRVSALRVATMLFGAFVHLLRRLPEPEGGEERLRRIRVLAEFALANMRGLLEDVYDERTHRFHFAAIDEHDYRQWLLSHGLPQEFADSAPVRFIYCGAFHEEPDGGPGRIAADMGLRSLLASLSYRGSLVWKLAAGTGASFTAPVYKMLAHRGVRFEFFSDVQRVQAPAGGEVESITIGVQAELREGLSEYDPLVRVGELDTWPSSPRLEQLDPAQAEALRAGAIDLECPWSGWAPVRERTLRRGVDFDRVVLAVPVREAERICAELVERSARWRDLSKVATTPTVGVQLWFRPTLEELGFRNAAWGLGEGDEPNSVIYASPLYSWTSMGLVLPYEGWPRGAQPGQLSYYCGTWATGPLPPFSDTAFPGEERARLVEATRRWLDESMGWFFPRAMREGPGGRPQFDLELLVDPSDPSNAERTSGIERLERQWFAVNAAPSAQYTLALPGTDRFRLAADESGVRNLFLAGDWTRFGLDVGHVEGAVISGLRAAQALLTQLGRTNLREIHPDIRLPGVD